MARAIQAAFAEVERDLISLRTKEALAQLKAQGVELGQQVQHSDETLERIVTARAAGDSYRSIAEVLNAEAVPTSRGGTWYPATVKRAAESRRAARLVARGVGPCSQA
jgi:DNA invertase Pin-like site-specific DNA recombinase